MGPCSTSFLRYYATEGSYKYLADLLPDSLRDATRNQNVWQTEHSEMCVSELPPMKWACRAMTRDVRALKRAMPDSSFAADDDNIANHKQFHFSVKKTLWTS